MKYPTVPISSIFQRFGGQLLNETECDLDITIQIPVISRLGLELNGGFFHQRILSLVCWGKAEATFLESLGCDQAKKIMMKIISYGVPAFILSRNFFLQEWLIDCLKKSPKPSAPVIQMDSGSSEMICTVGAWLAKRLAKWTTMHGVAVQMFGKGVLIIGEENIGKSEIALELMKMNHSFLADDAIDLARFGNTILARANEISESFIQIRGLGILNVKELFGARAIIDECSISIVIELKKFDAVGIELLGADQSFKNILGIPIPHYIIPTANGRKISEIIEAAVGDMKLRSGGYNSCKVFDGRIKKLLSNN